MRLRSSFWIAAMLTTPYGPAAHAGCQTGLASAPYIGAADMRRIDRAAAHLPRAAKGRIVQSIGAPVPRGILRVPVPGAVTKVLPQYKYAGYSAFRVDGQLAIVNGQGALSYLLPLGGTQAPGNCP